MSTSESIEEVELDLLLDGVARRYGYDFRDYARGSLRRRVRNVMVDEGLPTFSALQERLLRDPDCFGRFITGLSVNVTGMFRDPTVYLAFRRLVIPMLRTYPFIRVWHAGCATGEEVYSLAILLREEALYDRCLLYATDISEAVLTRARRGVFPKAAMTRYERLYRESGGTEDFSRYFVADEENAIMSESLREKIVFSQHSLVSDRSFNEFNVIFCRNVLIYFNQNLRSRVHEILYESLVNFGVLVLGLKEVVAYTPHADRYEALDPEARIYRRVR